MIKKTKSFRVNSTNPQLELNPHKGKQKKKPQNSRLNNLISKDAVKKEINLKKVKNNAESIRVNLKKYKKIAIKRMKTKIENKN